MLPLNEIATPAYVADVAKLKANLGVAARIKRETGCIMLLATKACSQFSLFPYMRDVLDGTTASGLYEARLGKKHFGGEVHVYSPAYTASEIDALIPLSDHIYFNSESQLDAFAPKVRAARPDAVIGLRVNPRLSLVKNSTIYDPSSPRSRFGIAPTQLTDTLIAKVDLLHFHNLCENMAADSVALIEHIDRTFGQYLSRVKYVNLGGGHYFSHANYDVAALIAAINALKTKYDVQVILESGAAYAYDAGYLVASVLDVIDNGSGQIAVLDTSATCHMPDVLEVPYRPHVQSSGEVGEKAHNYIFAGKTCLTGDIIGEYSFDAPLKAGDKVVFDDMLQYSMVKNTTFNGVPLPDIAILEENGTYRVVKSFGYSDFEGRLS